MQADNGTFQRLIHPQRPIIAIFISTIFLLGTTLRLLRVYNRPLWYDELQSVTHASLPLWDLLFSSLRYDPHPPLHNLQLSFWLLFGTSDAWIRLNSVLWSLFTFIPLYLLGYRLFGRAGAIISIYIFAISPTAILYAQEVRPYAMQIFLVTLSIYLLEVTIENSNKTSSVFWFSVSILMAIYSQGAGFLILIPFSLYTVMRLGGLLQVFSTQNRTLLIFGLIVFILTLPWVLLASRTSVGHLSSPDVARVSYDVTALILGPNHQINTALLFIVLIFIIILLSPSKQMRQLSFCFIIVPISVAIFVSLFLRPIWHIRLILVCLTPIILAIGGVSAWVRVRFRKSNYITLAIIAVITFIFLPPSLIVNKNTLERTAYFDAASFLLKNTEAGETIAFQHQRDAWGISWYLAGPGKLRTVSEKQDIVAKNGQIIIYRSDALDELEANVWVLRAGETKKTDNIVQFGSLVLALSEPGR